MVEIQSIGTNVIVLSVNDISKIYSLSPDEKEEIIFKTHS